MLNLIDFRDFKIVICTIIELKISSLSNVWLSMINRGASKWGLVQRHLTLQLICDQDIATKELYSTISDKFYFAMEVVFKRIYSVSVMNDFCSVVLTESDERI